MARHCDAAIVLIHVADGWVARNIKELELRESEEMREDRAYLERVSLALRAEGFDVDEIRRRRSARQQPGSSAT